MRRFILALLLLSLPAPGVAQTSRRWEPVKGINLAWLDGAYGHDFAPNPQHLDWGFDYKRESLDRAFRDIESMRMNVVRIFVFEDLEGLFFDDQGYVSGVDPILIRNFGEALELAADHHLKLYLSLGNNFRNKTRENGKRDIITDAKARRAYINNAVKPFVTMLKGKAVFAIDVHNEPEMEQMDRLPWEALHVYIKDVAAAIHRIDSTRRVSVGGGLFGVSVNAESVGKYKGLGLDFYDIHVYDHEVKIPPVRELNVSLPVLIGEFNSNVKKPLDLTDEDIAEMVKRLLPKARDGGYLGALYWDYGPGAGMQLVDNKSKEWRAAAYVLRDFDWTTPRSVPKKKRR